MKRVNFFGLYNFAAASLTSALLEIRTHKLRSFLSVLGITIGIASFVTSLSLGEMNKRATVKIISDLGGRDQLFINQRPALSPAEAYEFARSRGLRFSDLDSLHSREPDVAAAVKADWKFELYFGVGDEEYRIGVVGVNRAYVGQVRVLYGRTISDDEFARGDNVCIMTRNLLKKISGNSGLSPEQIIGRRLYISNGLVLRVVGIFEKESNVEDHITRNCLWTPLLYYERNVSGPDNAKEWFRVSLVSPDSLGLIKSRIGRVLKSLHRGVRDFSFEPMDWANEFEANMKNVNITFFLITLLSLLVGGLNIMNVMLVSISTRVWEIGMRKAVGASSFQVFAQFLIESSVLSVLGGALGLGLGYVSAQVAGSAMAESMPWLTPVFNRGMIGVGGAVSLLLGVLFGLYPAIKAFRMDPIEALHYE